MTVKINICNVLDMPKYAVSHNVTKLQTLESPSYFNFIHAHTTETRKTYKYYFSRYLQFNQVKDSDVLLQKTTKEIEQNLIKYIMHMKESGLAPNTIYCACASIFSFYEMNDIDLRKRKIKKYIGELRKIHKGEAYTHQQIAKLLKVSQERLKVIILLLSSTGMRIGALLSLKLKHLTKIQEYNLYQLVIYENTKSEHMTFCTTETASAIDSYLEYRKRCGEVLGPESPLIREDFDMNDPFRINKPQHIAVGSIKSTLQIHAVKAGLREVEASENNKRTRKKVPLCNGFRRFADTMMLNSEMNPVIKDMLIDHDVGLEKNYYRPTINDLLQEYLKAVNLLTIEESFRLKRKVQELTDRQDEISLMKLSHKKDMEEMRSRLNHNNEQLDRIISIIQENPSSPK